MQRLNIAIQDSAGYRDMAMQSYLGEKEACNELCETNEVNKDVLDGMLDDMSAPGGQYANDIEMAGDQAYAWSVFHTDAANPKKLKYRAK